MTRILLTAFLAAAFPAAAQITLQPAAPRVHDMIGIAVNGAAIGEEWSAATGPDVTMSGNRITVALPLTGGTGIPANLDWALGALPAGVYQVEVVKRAASGAVTSLAQASFNVAARGGNAPRTNYSDLWYNPDEAGWGINVQQHPSDKIFATWFLYGLDNRPAWYVIPDGVWTSPREYTGTLYRTRGPFLQDAVWNPSLFSVIAVGSATLQFNRYDSLLLSYNIEGVSGQKAVVRQGF
jgi:hypothetical protein